MKKDRCADISVIIPCYNCSQTIDRALSSVINQTLTPKEIILIDDASDDDTLKALYAMEKRHPNLVSVVSLDENVGSGEARNAGWDAASGKYLAFLDADDTWSLSKLAIQFSYMESEPSVVLSGHLCELIKDFEGDRSDAVIREVTEISKVGILIKNPFSTPTVMVKRNLSIRFHKGKRYAEDFFLWQRVVFSKARVVRLEISLAFLHKPKYGDTGLSSHLSAMEKEELNNFYELFRENYIGLFFYVVASVFSLFKYFKRTLVSILGAIVRR